ncbi:MAG TPA: SMC-Scp complex subunit ScpB [Alphaproteobacteria bacterium]|nr:SMC-Scp complex subunit ScpB [Alphaproteobacteria bacterium]
MTDTHPDFVTADVEDDRAPAELQAQEQGETPAQPEGPAERVADQAEPSAEEISRAQAHALALRTLEAVLFAASEPMEIKALAKRLPVGSDVEELADELMAHYANRGIHLVRTGTKLSFRTAPDLVGALQIETVVPRKLSRAAIETLAIIAYHQPVTRAEIEEIRGVALSRGTLDTLMESGWIQPRGHRETPGHPATWVTTPEFLSHFGLGSTKDLPGLEELKAAGLLDARPAVSAYSEEGKLGEVKPEAEEQDRDVAAELETPAEPEEPKPA